MIRAHAGDYIASRGGTIPWPHVRVLHELAACRTAALGGHAWECDTCGGIEVAYNSCRNRHCPTCGGSARAEWLEGLRQELLPTSYFHLVFTLPSELSPVVQQNPEPLYNLLFRAAWETLEQVGADPRHLGAQLGALLVLHTWNQRLEHHPHVHCVLPAGGLAPDGSRWVPSPSKDFFLPVRVLSALFRGKYLAGLKRAWQNGELKLEGNKLLPLADERQFEAWLSPLYARDWVVYAQPPPPDCGPEAVLKYLARYVSGVAIANSRLVSLTNGQVAFRWKNRRKNRTETQTLSAAEFLRRFLLHVLPTGFVRIRRYGLWANNHRAAKLTRCRELLGTPPSVSVPCALDPIAPKAAADDDVPVAERERQCPWCAAGRLHFAASRPRPASWMELLQLPLWRLANSPAAQGERSAAAPQGSNTS